LQCRSLLSNTMIINRKPGVDPTLRLAASKVTIISLQVFTYFQTFIHLRPVNIEEQLILARLDGRPDLRYGR
jgi:hypothetical protein